MSKYVLYRTAIDDQPVDEELVAVEFGASFEDVLEDFLQARVAPPNASANILVDYVVRENSE